ncbi:MAG: ATP-binding cassette domain-containing protein [FCB group bacterium]|nr:ATP-binding cassette domain-containing protein [FCB group bacterium]
MSTYARILRYVKPYKGFVVVALLSSLFFVTMNSSSVWMVGSLISKIMTPAAEIVTDVAPPTPPALSLNDKLKGFTDFLIGHGDQASQLARLCLVLLIVFLLKNIFYYINKVTLDWVQNRWITDLRQDLFTHIHALPLSFFDRNKSAELQSIMIRDVDVMRSAFTQTIQKLIIEPVNLLAFITLLFIISVKMTLITLLIIPVSAVVIVKLGQSIRRKARRSSIQIAGVMNVLQETLAGMRIVKAFSMEKTEIRKFSIENNKFFKLIFRQTRMRSMSTPINEIIGVSIGVVLLWVGGMDVLSGKGLGGDDFMRYIILLFAMLQPAKSLGNVNSQIQAALASADRVFNILDTDATLKEIANPVPISRFTGVIEFKDVSFKYESSAVHSLSHVDAAIHKGEIVALVGLSGAGKTTFVDLIPRFYDVTSGSITIDGIDIRKLSLSSLRGLMGIVTQETILFNDTIGNNIAYGSPDKTPDQIRRAARMANALEFIEQLPEKFDTPAGEKGARLSGGEKQRIAIARAILKDPEILILDEATSALDSEAERKVQEAIDLLVKDRTVIVIAHRLSTIIKSDKIIVLDKGIIVEQGTHSELLSLKGKYRQLYDLQFKDEIDDKG